MDNDSNLLFLPENTSTSDPIEDSSPIFVAEGIGLAPTEHDMDNTKGGGDEVGDLLNLDIQDGSEDIVKALEGNMIQL